jgi:hypothetical protein
MFEKDDPFATSPPPRKGDLLFRDDLPDGHNNACLNVSSGNDRAAYLEGYRRGARFLVGHVVEERHDQDFLVYPIIFLYRHHIELALKNMILQCPYLIGRQLNKQEEENLKQHKLKWLWRDLKPMLRALCQAHAPLPEADVEGIDDYIEQLTAMDADSFAFRYAHTKGDEPSLPGVKQINLRHFAVTIERLADYFDGLDAALYSLVEHKSETEEYWRSEMADYMGYA